MKKVYIAPTVKSYCIKLEGMVAASITPGGGAGEGDFDAKQDMADEDMDW